MPALPKKKFRLLPPLAVLLASALAPHARAQQSSVVGSSLAQVAGTAVPVGDSTRFVTDVFLGRDSAGPYMLSWKGIESAGIRVTRDGQQLVPDVDYRVNTTAGTLVFTAPLRARQIARVDYVAAAGKAAQVQTPLALPTAFSLMNQANGALTLQALFNPTLATTPGASMKSPTDLMTLSFAGNAVLASQSSLTSRFYLDGRGGNVLSRSGMKVAEKSKLRYGQMSVSFARAGEGFRAVEGSGLTAGQQLLQADASLNPIGGIQAAASFQQTALVPDSGAGLVTTTLGERVSGTVGAGTRFLASHNDTTVKPDGGAASTRTVDRLQVDQSLGAKTQATALIERTDAASDGSHAVSETNKLTVRSQPTPQVSVQGTYTNSVLPTGPTDTTNLQVDAAATKRIHLLASVGDQFTRTGATHSRQAALQYQTGASLALTGNVQMQSTGTKDTLVGGLGATFHPSRYLELTGGVRLRDAMVSGAPDPNALDTYDMKLAMRVPWTSLKVTGAFTDNPDDTAGTVAKARARSLGLQSTVGPLDLSGSYGLQQDLLAARTNTTLDFKVGWRLARTTQIQTGYRQTLAIDTGLFATDTYTLGLTHRLGSLLDLTLSGSVTMSERDHVAQSNPDVSAQAKLGLKF